MSISTENYFHYISHALADKPMVPVFTISETKKIVCAGDLLNHVEQLATELRAQGVCHGSVVVLCDLSQVQMATLCLAVWQAEGIAVPLDKKILSHPLSEYLDICTANFLISGRKSHPNMFLLKNLWEEIDCHKLDPKSLKVKLPETTAMMAFTSGTTGMPKAVMLSHANLVAAACSMQEVALSKQGQRVLIALPIAHMYGMSVMLSYLGVAGHIIFHEPTTDGWTLIQVALKNDVSVLPLQPVHIIDILKCPDQLATLSGHIECLATASGNVRAADLERLASILEGVKIVVYYALTEVPRAVACVNPHKLPAHKRHTIGKPSPRMSVSLHPIGNDNYEMILSGDMVALGYLRADGSVTLFEGVFATGDLVCTSDDSLLYWNGRRSDLLQVCGKFINPWDIEKRVLEIDGIRAAVVLLNPDQEQLSILCEFSSGVKDTASESILNKLGEWRQICKICPVEQLPRTANGKISRNSSQLFALLRSSQVNPHPIMEVRNERIKVAY